MRHFLSLSLLIPLLAVTACDDADFVDDEVGGKADDASSERAKGYLGRDFYDIDRFDVDNVGRVCGFERARRGSITSATKVISLSSVSFPLTTVFATDDRPIKLERLSPDRTLFEKPVFVGTIADEPGNLTVTVFLDRLSLEPDVMLISRDGGGFQLCQGLSSFE